MDRPPGADEVLVVAVVAVKLPPWTIVMIVVGLGALLWFRGCEGNAQGALKERIKVLEEQNDSLKSLGLRQDTLYVRQTDTLRIVRHRTDSILMVDTLLSVDTVRVLITAERRACDALLQTCEEQKANLRAQVSNRDSVIGLLKKRKGSRFGCAGPVVASTSGVGLGVGCGVKLF